MVLSASRYRMFGMVLLFLYHVLIIVNQTELVRILCFYDGQKTFSLNYAEAALHVSLVFDDVIASEILKDAWQC